MHCAYTHIALSHGHLTHNLQPVICVSCDIQVTPCLPCECMSHHVCPLPSVLHMFSSVNIHVEVLSCLPNLSMSCFASADRCWRCLRCRSHCLRVLTVKTLKGRLARASNVPLESLPLASPVPSGGSNPPTSTVFLFSDVTYFVMPFVITSLPMQFGARKKVCTMACLSVYAGIP